MKRGIRRVFGVLASPIVAALLVSIAGPPSRVALAAEHAPEAAGPLSPEETVRRYLAALKDGNFDRAYDLVSAAMRQGKDREVWVKEQKTGMSFADVKIFDFKVYPGKVEGDVAHVPDVLSSQDRFVNQLGLTEYELYTLIKENGVWKVDQQVIVEPGDLAKWFPDKGAPTGLSH